MQITLPRSRVMMLANIVERFSQRYPGTALAAALVAVAADLNQMIAEHDKQAGA